MILRRGIADTVYFVKLASAATKLTLQAGAVKPTFSRPLVFYNFFSLNVVNTLQNTVYSKDYLLVYFIFLISTSTTAFYRPAFQKLIAQLISESYNNSHKRVKITPQGGVTIFGVNITPKRS